MLVEICSDFFDHLFSIDINQESFSSPQAMRLVFNIDRGTFFRDDTESTANRYAKALRDTYVRSDSI